MGRHFISGALLNFLNVREWTPEALLQYAKDHGETETAFGDIHGHEPWVKSRAFPDQEFYFDPQDEHVIELRAAGPAQRLGIKNGQIDYVDIEDTQKYTLPGEPEYKDFLTYLGGQLRAEWIDRIREFQEKGKLSNEYMDHLRTILKISFFNDFSIYAYCNNCQIEAWLERDFFNTIAFGTGDLFKKLRECKNPECRQWFFYNRPKQLFCSEHCRHDFHNRVKIDSGYLKRHQQKKRDEGNPAYF